MHILEGSNKRTSSVWKKIWDLEFFTCKEAYKYYNSYALKADFGIHRESNAITIKSRSEIIARTSVCNNAERKRC